MVELSRNAKFVAGTTFWLKTSLRYKMAESLPSPEMQNALDELVSAGVLDREDEHSGAVLYKASASVSFLAFKDFARSLVKSGNAPTIRLFVPKYEDFPQPRRKDGGEPCGECRIQPGETCDICGAVNPAPQPKTEPSPTPMQTEGGV